MKSPSINIILEQEQEELLSTLVEAAWNVPRDKRATFYVRGNDETNYVEILHPGLQDSKTNAYPGDINTLAHRGLLALTYLIGGTYSFDIDPQGFAYYKQIKQRIGQPIQEIQTNVITYLESDHFRKKYPAAYQTWNSAATMLLVTDSENQLTTIGHLCREAVQEFITTLVDKYKPVNVSANKKETVARLRAVLDVRVNQLGNVEQAFLKALISYWGEVNDLIQRQVHGAKKEGQTLIWEDGRRVVFQTAMVMFEIDRSLSRTH